jgi:hypothetical protein
MRKFFVLAAVTMTACSEDEPAPRATNDAVAETTTDTATPIDTAVADTMMPDTQTIDSAPSDVAETSVDAGTEADCIDATSMDAYFTLEDSTKCLVAKYDVPVASLGNLTWGRHGGPLGFESGTTPNLVRYELPGTVTGALTIKKTAVTVGTVPSGIFWGSQAIDLPFFGWTAFSYTGSGMGYPGKVFLVNTTGDVKSYDANGFFAAAAIGLSSTSGGRLLHTGLGGISSAPTTTNAGGVYAADSCGSGSTNPRLLPDGDGSCKAPIKVASWEAGSSGPVAVDPDENFFAILSTFGGKQELRGFERSTIARGAGETAGTMLFNDTQYTSDLVADGKNAYWQPNDPSTYTPVDPKMLAYKVDAATKKVAADGMPKTFLTLKKSGTSLTLVRDSSRRVWVGLTVPGTGDAGPTGSVFFVLRAKKP